MRRKLLLLALAFVLALCSQAAPRNVLPVSASGGTLTLVSDPTTEYFDGSNWHPAVAAWMTGAWPSIQGATWIWKSYLVTLEEAQNGVGPITFRRTFSLPAYATNASGSLRITADNAYRVYLNGSLLGRDGTMNPATYEPYPESWLSVETYTVRPHSGENTLTFEIVGYEWPNSTLPQHNPAAFVWRLDLAWQTTSSTLAFQFPWAIGPDDGTDDTGWIYQQGPHSTSSKHPAGDGLDFEPYLSSCPDVLNAWIRPTLPGLVTWVGDGPSNDGLTTSGQLFLMHGSGEGAAFQPNGWMTRYEHLADPQVGGYNTSPMVHVDTYTNLGKPSCLKSNGGTADIPHVHIGIWHCTDAPSVCEESGKSSSDSFFAHWHPVDLANSAISFCGYTPDSSSSSSALTKPGQASVAPAWLTGKDQRVKCGLLTGTPETTATQHVDPSQTATKPFGISQLWKIISVIFHLGGSSVQSTLTSPGGLSIAPDNLPPGATYLRGETFEQYLIPDNEVGTWQANITGVDVPPEGEDLTISVEGCAAVADGTIGDPCSADDDSDAVGDSVDNCPLIYNPDQADANANGIGDACEEASAAAVGGIADLPDAPGAAPQAAESSGGSSMPYAVVAGAAAGGALLLLAAGAWYSRRRWPGWQ